VKYVIQPCEVKYPVVDELLNTFTSDEFDLVVAYADKRIEYDEDSTQYLKEVITKTVSELNEKIVDGDEVYLLCMSGALQVSDCTTAIETVITCPKYKMIFSKPHGTYVVREW
jgi:molybdopterin converting factor small subunit